MMNSAWPSLYWQLYDYYLRPTAAYYAARIANEPVQLIYDYGNNSVYAVNESRQDVLNLKAVIKILDVNSRTLRDKILTFNVSSNSTEKIFILDSIKETIFLDLKIIDPKGNRITGNFYWLSGKPDEFEWNKTTWAFTPMKSYTDYTALNHLHASAVAFSYKLEEKGSNMVIHTHISNPGSKIAFFVSMTLNDNSGKSISPLFWDDNYFSLLPGEKREISCTIAKSRLKGIKPEITLTGWNVQKQKHKID